MTIATWRLQIKQEWARTYSNGGWVTSLDSRDNMGSAGQTSRLPHFWSPASLILVRRLFRALNFRALREQREKPVPPSSTWHLKKQDTHTHTHTAAMAAITLPTKIKQKEGKYRGKLSFCETTLDKFLTPDSSPSPSSTSFSSYFFAFAFFFLLLLLLLLFLLLRIRIQLINQNIAWTRFDSITSARARFHLQVLIKVQVAAVVRCITVIISWLGFNSITLNDFFFYALRMITSN